MDGQLKHRLQLLSAWCGPAFLLTFLLFWAVLGLNLPNHWSPSLSPGALAAHYSSHLTEVRVGVLVSLIIVVLYMPWTALVTAQMAEIEGDRPIMAYLQLIGGALTVIVVSLSDMFWAIAAYRPGRSPQLIQLLTDSGWLCIDLQYACTTLQMVALGLVVIGDKREVRLMPKWAGYLTIACSMTFFPATLTGVVKSGPFAWNGVMSYYFPYFCWLLWWTVASVYVIKEVRRRAAVKQAMRSATLVVSPA